MDKFDDWRYDYWTGEEEEEREEEYRKKIEEEEKERETTMTGKLRLDITPIEGEWDQRYTILQICKEAIEAWKGNDLTGGYKAEIIFDKHQKVFGMGIKQAPFLYLEAIEEKIPSKPCEECDGTGRVDEVEEEK